MMNQWIACRGDLRFIGLAMPRLRRSVGGRRRRRSMHQRWFDGAKENGSRGSRLKAQ
jgi:hypothetical protein